MLTHQKRKAKKSQSLGLAFKFRMVPRAGVEPARPHERGILSPLRLPISPPRHQWNAHYTDEYKKV